jgi:hypothetical protein
MPVNECKNLLARRHVQPHLRKRNLNLLGKVVMLELDEGTVEVEDSKLQRFRHIHFHDLSIPQAGSPFIVSAKPLSSSANTPEA